MVDRRLTQSPQDNTNGMLFKHAVHERPLLHMVYKVRTKIERLLGRMKKRLKMGIVYRRGIKKFDAHIVKLLTKIYILASAYPETGEFP